MTYILVVFKVFQRLLVLARSSRSGKQAMAKSRKSCNSGLDPTWCLVGEERPFSLKFASICHDVERGRIEDERRGGGG